MSHSDTPQDAVPPRTLTTRSDSAPLSTGDVYGTRLGRLQFIASLMLFNAESWRRCKVPGALELAAEFQKAGEHYLFLARVETLHQKKEGKR